MNFSHLFPLWWLLAAIPLVLLYFNLRPATAREVSAGWLWRKAWDQRTFWQRWQKPVSLAVLLFLLALIVLAAMEPYFSRRSRSVVYLFDTSASMNARDVSPSRLAAARKAARKHIEGLGRQEEAALVAAGNPPTVICPFTRDRTRLLQGLKELETGSGNNLESAIGYVRAMLKERGGGEILLFSDGGANLADDSEDLQQLQFAAAAENAGIVELAARRRLTDGKHEVLVGVFNGGGNKAKGNILVECGDRQSVSFSLQPGETVHKILTIEAPAGGLLTASLENQSDHFPADDRAWLFLPPFDQGVFLSGRPHPAVLKALQAMPGLLLTENPTSQYDSQVIVGGPFENVSSGPVLVISPAESSPWWDYEGEIERPLRVNQVASTVVAPILQDATLEGAARLKLKSQPEMLLETEDGTPLLFFIGHQDGRVLVLNVSLEKSDLPLRSEFPRLIAGLLNLLHPAGQIASPLRAGKALQLAATSEKQSLVSPSGISTEVSETSPILFLNEPGIWVVENSSEETVAGLPVGLLNGRESDLRAQAADEPMPAATGRSRPVAFFLLVLALVLACGYWVLAQRGILI